MKSENIEILKNGGVGVIPTDTLYGLVGKALDETAVSRIIKIKNRSNSKGFIVLISSFQDLNIFGIEINQGFTLIDLLKRFWPGAVSVILEISDPKFNYLKKDGAIAFRLPDKPDLIEILKQIGPLVAPSANPEGQSPAKTIEEARKYFTLPAEALAKGGDQPDFYQDGGASDSEPSTLMKINGDKVEILREGAVKVF